MFADIMIFLEIPGTPEFFGYTIFSGYHDFSALPGTSECLDVPFLPDSCNMSGLASKFKNRVKFRVSVQCRRDPQMVPTRDIEKNSREPGNPRSPGNSEKKGALEKIGGTQWTWTNSGTSGKPRLPGKIRNENGTFEIQGPQEILDFQEIATKKEHGKKLGVSANVRFP